MDLPIAALGVIAVLLIIADNASESRGTLDDVFRWLTVALGVVFAAEFVIRVCIAPNTGEYLRRNWWQIPLIVLPFLRILRVTGRVARLGRLASSTLRASRSASGELTTRLSWLIMITIIVILTSAQLLYDFAAFDYGDALHDATLATINGEPIESSEPLAQTLDVLLGIYAVVVVAALAGMLGAFFLEQRKVPAPGSAGVQPR